MTVEEILKQAGLDDAAIKGLDAKITSAFSGVLTAAEQKEQTAQAAAAKAAEDERKMKDWWEKDATKQINEVYSETAAAKAQAEFYRAQAESAKASGFIPKEAPGYVPPPNPGAQPQNQPTKGGEPKYMTATDAYTALTATTWALAEHMRLFEGKPLPDDVDVLVKEATENRMDFKPYVAKKYKFDERKQEIAATAQKAHDDKIRQEATAEVEKKYAERQGQNPNLRVVEESRFSKYRENQAANGNKYPGSMNQRERHAQVRKMIQERATA